MKWSPFLKYLGVISVLLFLWAFGISDLGNNKETLWIYIISILSFVVFSILIFLYAYNTSASDALFSFNNVVSASFLFKMILSIGMLMIYERIFKPESNFHILHFIIVYIIYTIYEVYYLTKLAKSSD